MLSRRIGILLAAALSCSTVAHTTGCTPIARADAQTGVKDISTVATDVAPGCTELSLAGSTEAAKVCGVVATDVASVAQIVQSILDALPPAMKRPAALAVTPGVAELVTKNGVRVTVTKAAAEQVRAGLVARGLL